MDDNGWEWIAVAAFGALSAATFVLWLILEVT